MAGPDAYKEFDHSSIVSTSTSKGSVYIGRFSFRKRDLLLGGIAIFALLLVIILAIVLAIRASDSDSCDDNRGPTNQGQTGSHQGPGTSEENLPYCVTLECLQAATYQKPIMDPNINPCDNFYSFACGQYSVHHPQSQFIVDVTPSNEILFENTDNLVYVLASNVNNNHIHSYERKLKDFMSSCNNHFDKMDLRGRPLVEKIIQPLGGWDVFNTYDENEFDFNELLRKIHVDFWSDPFFTLSTEVDKTNWNDRIVELTFSGMRLNFRYYVNSPFLRPFQRTYRSYISLIAQLLTIDAGLPINNTKIETFVSDVYAVESSISYILQSVFQLFTNHEPENRVTLGELEAHMNNTVDLVALMKAVFNEWPGHFESSTRVALGVVNYFNQIGDLISTFQETSDGKRTLHNYMMWQAIEPYVSDLSWDYVHAKRKLNHLVYGQKDDSSGYLYCFNIAESVFPEAMSAVYVKRHIKDEGKNEASNILDRIRNILINRLQNIGWMSEDDRREAVDKIGQSLYKIGFPDELVDENYMDNYYYRVSISDSDFFSNILSMNRIYQKNINDAVGNPGSRSVWTYHVFQPVIEYFNPWAELIVTAAMLQNPLFSAKGPAYYKYGGIGSRLASNLIHAVDEIGSGYKLDGSHFGRWWSNVTRQHYSDIRECAIRKQNKEDFGTFFDEQGNVFNVSRITAFYAPEWAPEVLADSSGVRIAYQAFKDLQRQEGREKLPPGFESLDNDKMFFVAYAQSFCQNVPEYIKTARTQIGTLPNMNKVNLAVRNIPEFNEAFSCPKPAESDQCLLFGK